MLNSGDRILTGALGLTVYVLGYVVLMGFECALWRPIVVWFRVDVVPCRGVCCFQMYDVPMVIIQKL